MNARANNLLCASLAAALFSATTVSAQAPPPQISPPGKLTLEGPSPAHVPPPMPPQFAQPPAAQSATGVIRDFTYAPRGEVDGFVLDNGTLIHSPPHLGTQVVAIATPGSQVRVDGWNVSGPAGDARLEARVITNLANNQTLDVGAAPPPAGPPGAFIPPPPAPR